MTDHPGNSKGPGVLLANAREDRGWTRRYIGDQINLKVDYVESLETDNFSALPPATFVMGYIRSYCKLLEIDPEPLLTRYRELTQPEEPSVAFMADQQREEHSQHSENSNLFLVLTVSALVALLFGGGWWYLGSQGDSTSVTVQMPMEDSAMPDAEGELKEDFLPDEVLFKDTAKAPAIQPSEALVGSEFAQSNSVEDKPLNESSEVQSMNSITTAPVIALSESRSQNATTEIVSTDGLQRDISSAVDQSDGEESAETEAKPILPDEDVLLLKASEDSWVSVTDADSVRLMYGVLTSGTPRKLEGIAPFSMVFGAAAGIEVTLNGEPIDFTSMIRKSKTARFLIRQDGSLERQSQDN